MKEILLSVYSKVTNNRTCLSIYIYIIFYSFFVSHCLLWHIFKSEAEIFDIII